MYVLFDWTPRPRQAKSALSALRRGPSREVRLRPRAAGEPHLHGRAGPARERRRDQMPRPHLRGAEETSVACLRRATDRTLKSAFAFQRTGLSVMTSNGSACEDGQRRGEVRERFRTVGGDPLHQRSLDHGRLPACPLRHGAVDPARGGAGALSPRCRKLPNFPEL